MPAPVHRAAVKPVVSLACTFVAVVGPPSTSLVLVRVAVPPPLGAPRRGPVVVGSVVERFKAEATPTPLTASAPVVAPSAELPTAVSVPALTIVPPAYVLAPLSVRVLAPIFVTP